MIELQRKLMGDRIRNDAFHRALKKVIVRDKTTVVDIGSGTGFLSFLAEKLGAAQCVLMESGDIATISELLALYNGMERCVVVHGASFDVDSDGAQFDVVMSETLGNYALEENIIEIMNDAKRFLKKGGTMIPQRIDQYVCPVIGNRLINDIDIWGDIGFDLDFGQAREVSLHNMYVKKMEKKDLWPKGEQKWDTVELTKAPKSVRTGTAKWKAKSAVTVSGVALWWEALLVPGVTLSTSPFSKPTHWDQIFLPFLEPVSLKAGETLEVKLRSDTRLEVKIHLQWEAKVIGKNGKAGSVQKMDMQKGFLA